jgi:DNA invertase Pin-like site-specific DNA recombinase
MKNPTVPNLPKKAIFYARVSSEGQVDNTSIDTQLDRGKAYAISQGWTLDRIFIDGGESGKSTDRTHFQEMVSYIRENPALQQSIKIPACEGFMAGLFCPGA